MGISFGTRNKKIIVDFDDVLCPCNSLAVAQYNREHPDEEPMTIDEIVGWGITGNRTDALLAYYADCSSDCYQKQRPFPGAVSMLMKLSEYMDVYLCTSAASSELVGFRIDQIHRFFPCIPASHIILSSEKDVVSEGFDFMLDDSPKHILASRASVPILFRKPWNRGISGVAAASCYEDVIALVETVLGQSRHASPDQPSLIVLVGPTGCRKSDVLSFLMQDNDSFVRVPSYTTRKDAMDGYHIVSVEEFLRRKADGLFAETTYYASNHYGTDTADIHRILDGGHHAVMAADISGAIVFRRIFGDRCRLVFCDRDRMSIIREILSRDMDLDEKSLRIAYLDAEIANRHFCDLSICTDNVESASKELRNFLLR